MPENDGPRKTSFKITLNESVVFLRPNRSRSGEPPPSLLRGLLILELAKPTRITSIELDLQAESLTSWPDGIGARRVNVTEEHKIFHASTMYFQASKAETRRTESIGPGISSSSRREITTNPSSPVTQADMFLRQSPETPQTNRDARMLRRVSADSSIFQRTPISHHTALNISPIPPYSPFPPNSTPPNSTPPTPVMHNLSTVDENTAQTLDTMQTVRREVKNSRRRSLGGFVDLIGLSPAPSRSVSRRPSAGDVPEDDPGPSAAQQSPQMAPNKRNTSHSGTRDRKARFSLSSVPNILMEVVRSGSQKSWGSAETGEDGQRRGRTTEKRPLNEPENDSTRAGGFGENFREADDVKEAKEGWKEFKRGTYTYPISFTIPGNSPPSLLCAFGSVVWRLRATVHRPGAFTAKMVTTREVKVIASPVPDGAEEEIVGVEREWEQQLQYQITLLGRHFYIGGQIPFTLTLIPLSKIKIHQLSVYIEERVDYYTQMQRIARTDPIIQVDLLVLKSKSKPSTSILPLQSDDTDAFKQSPLSVLLNPGDDVSELVSNLMGPGPWKICRDLQLPSQCSALRYTNKNRRSNIVISHTLKCVIRLERGEDLHTDPKTGKQKLYDIIVQTPIQILSTFPVPLQSNWSTLPEYTELFNDIEVIGDACPCSLRRPTSNDHRTRIAPPLGSMGSRPSSESEASAVEGSLANRSNSTTQGNDLLYRRNAQFERLVAGQESEFGEAPPAYDASITTSASYPHEDGLVPARL
ncbi:hypothetical protein BD779DRAFT_1513256 [Infundibulicybe gibba]|nr:hypothetical protein BD779DRAFT_1513256 [Infundibulicybe gibba]